MFKRGLIAKNSIYVLSIIIIGLVIVLYTNSSGTIRNTVTGKVVQGQSTITLQASSASLALGSQLKLDIVVDGAIDISGVQLSISYNPNVLAYDKTVEGDFLKQGNAQTLFLTDTIDTSLPGLVKDVVIARIGSGANGNGVIASVYFNSASVGSSDLKFANVLLADKDGNTINANQVESVVAVASPATQGNGIGLKGEYFDNKDFSNLKVIRIDPEINFDWGRGSVFDSKPGSPDPAIEPDTFSVRWLGQVQPKYSEAYTFYTVSDDGVRLWVDDKLLIDDWNDHPSTEKSGAISLIANQKYNIKVEYYENGGSSSIKLLWSSSSQSRESIPKTQLYPVSIAGPTVDSFAASASTITSGQSTTLSWSTNGATSVSIDNGIGNVQASGSRSVSPSQTTTYTLTASNSAGIATKEAAVAVSQAQLSEIKLQPSSNQLGSGERLRLDIVASKINNLAGAELSISYDPNVLKYYDTIEGDFLKQGNAQTLFLKDTIDSSQAGMVKNIVIARIGSGANGNGVIASVYFDAVDAGSSDLKLAKVLLADPDGNVINVNKVDSVVSVVKNQSQAKNRAPVVSPIHANVEDVHSAARGIQFYENTTVIYSATATDPDNNLLSWKWLYKIENMPEQVIKEGIGNIQPVEFLYATGTAGIVYNWKLIVDDGQNTRERQFVVKIINKSSLDRDDEDDDDEDDEDDRDEDGIDDDEDADDDGDDVDDARDKCKKTLRIVIGQKPNVNKYGCLIPKYTKFSLNLSTNLSDVDLVNFTGFRVGIQNLGQIDFGDNPISLITNIANDSEPIDLDDVIFFLPQKVIVDSNKLKTLNKSAIIKIMNLTNVINPIILKDGVQCSDCKILIFMNKELNFEVKHFTEYSVEEGSYCGDNYCSSQEGCSSCSSDCGECPAPPAPSGGGGGGGGAVASGGGGGGAGSVGLPGFVCIMDWQCRDWSQCVNGVQTRQCNFVRVPQHYKDGICPQESQQPEISRTCEVSTETAVAEPEITQTEPSSEEPTFAEELLKEFEAEEKPAQLSKGNIAIFIFAFIILAVLVLISVHTFRVHMGPGISKKEIGSDQKYSKIVSSYISKMRVVGRSDKYIEDTLLKAGWPARTVKELLKKK